MKVDLFDFHLPEELIAQQAAEPRDSARLLVPGERGIKDAIFRDLPGFLKPGDLLVFNDTKVIPTRLYGRRGDAGIEVTLHKETAADSWLAFARPAKKLKPGDRIDFEDLSATVTEKHEGGEVLLKFDRSGANLREALWHSGTMPLPPYIRRARGEKGETAENDRNRYQTVFAREEGAVAAPTAGLHFTEELLARLDHAGIDRTFVTLHVGAGTFLPVKVDDTEDHVMHSEWGRITEANIEAVERARGRGGRIIAVGTTAMRLLESAAEPDGSLHPFEDETDIFITPGYRFRIVEGLVTNFHLPKSTLFMLVSAFAGLERMKVAYAHAIEQGYRFYSYGDSSLLWRNDTDRT